MAGPIRIAILANGRQARSEAALTASSYDRMGKRITRAGRGLASVFAIAQLARAAVAVGKVGATYVDSLNKIQALTGSTDRQMARVAKTIESQSSAYARFGQTTGDAAAGMVELTKSGLSADKALAAIRGTMTLAKAGELEVAAASELVANTLNTFSLKASQASKIANGLANAANISSADVSDLAESFKYVSPLAAKAGVSLDQTNAVLAQLANSGIKASQAGTSFRKFLLSLQAPSGAAKDAIEKLNVSVYDSDGNMRSLGSIIDQLGTGLSGLTQKAQNTALKDIFGLTGITGAQVLIKNGVDGLNEYTKGVQRVGAANKLAESASKGLAGTIGTVKAQATSTAQSLYRIYSPAIDSALRKVISFATKHKKILIPALIGATVAAAGFAVAVGVIAAVTSPVVLLGAAVAGVGAATAVAYQRSERFREIVASVGDIIQTKVVPALQAFGAYVKGAVIPAAQAFGNYLLNTTVPAIVRTAQTVSQRLQPILRQAADTFRSDIRPALAQVVAKFQEWQPGLKRAAETTGRLYARLVVLGATVTGKVVPAIIKLGGVFARSQVPAVLKAISVGIKYVQVMISIDRAIIRAVVQVARFAAAVKTKMGEAIRFVASIPSRVTAALGSLGSLLFSAGSELIGGFISGITSRIGDVEGTLRSLTGKLTSWKGPPAKDASLLTPAGKLLMAGLIKGIEDGSTGVRAALERITKLIEDKLDGKKQAARRKALLKSLRDERAALIANGKAQDRNNKALDKAISQYKALRAKADDFARSLKAGFQTYGSIVGLGTTGGGTGVTLPAILSQLTARAVVADQFAAVIASLRDRLNKTSLKQLLDQAASGDLEGALATAQAIASGGQGAVNTINQLTAQITAAGEALGRKMRRKFFGHGLEVADGVVKGLERRQRQLDRIADRLAKEFLRKAGIYTKTPESSGGSPKVAASKTPALDAFASRSTTSAAPVSVQVVLTAEQLSEIEKGRKVQISLDAYRSAGGRPKVRTP